MKSTIKNSFLTVGKTTIFAAAFAAVTMVSCQDKTKDKVEDAAGAVATDVEQKVDTLTTKADEVIDTAQAKTAKVLEKGAEKMDAAAEKLKEAAKK